MQSNFMSAHRNVRSRFQECGTRRKARSTAGIKLAFVAFAFGASFSAPAFASSFECPAIGDLPTSALEDKIDTLLPIGKVLGQPAELYEAASLLRDHGMTDDNAVNHLVALYCPAVAEDTSLSDAEKTDQVRRFAAEATQVVSQLGETEEITYTIRLEPTLAERIEDEAKSAGTSVESWIKKVVADTVK